jgi:hypothetical protein
LAKRLEGNGLWESSRIILPEHRNELAARKEFGTAAKASKRPTRDEFELEEIGNQLIEAHQEGYPVTLSVWGREEQLSGQISKLDPQTRLVHVQRKGETFEITKVPFLDIMKIEKLEMLE